MMSESSRDRQFVGLERIIARSELMWARTLLHFVCVANFIELQRPVSTMPTRGVVSQFEIRDQREDDRHISRTRQSRGLALTRNLSGHLTPTGLCAERAFKEGLA